MMTQQAMSSGIIEVDERQSMTARIEDVIKRLSPQQVDALLQRAELMANEPRPRGKKLRADWAGCIDTEHTSGSDAQKSAMQSWTQFIERSLT